MSTELQSNKFDFGLGNIQQSTANLPEENQSAGDQCRMTVSQAAWCLYVLMHYYIKRSGGPVPESPTLISLIR